MPAASGTTTGTTYTRRLRCGPSLAQRFACLEQGLQVAQDPVPSAAAMLVELALDSRCHHRCTLELVVNDGQTRESRTVRFELPGDAREPLGLVAFAK